MANMNPYQAHAARRRAKVSKLEKLAGKLWKAAEAAEALLGDEDTGIRLKAIHALSQVAGSYVKVYEVGELQRRIEALEAAEQARERGQAQREDVPSLDGAA